MSAAPTVSPDTDTRTEVDPQPPYDLLLWNDDVNTTVVVAYALQRVLGLDAETAEQRMWEAHERGKAVVFTGERDRAVGYAERLHTFGLQATVAKAGAS